MLFADHYAKDWFSLWETRWYTGFNIVSYPPLTHQLIAILIPFLGFEKAYAVMLWLVTTLYPLGIYGFSRNFTGKNASAYAALSSAFMLPIFVTAHIFGQLPFLTATLFALFGTAALTRFLKEGGISNFLMVLSVTATTMAAHHATLMIQPFFIFATTIFQLKRNNWQILSSRLLAYLIAAIPASLMVIWPFWSWGTHQQLQTPIDHLSRHNFFTDPLAIAIFFFPFYFPIGLVIPFLFKKWPLKFIGLQLCFFFLFILGLGGTTPLPHWLFGKSWEWLTYDRFAFWAALTLTPFFGILLIRFKRSIKTRFSLNPVPASLQGTFLSASILIVFICSAMGSWFTPMIFPIQPARIDMKPIVDWLGDKDHYYWRYLTFGFGDQFAYLNLLTDKTTTMDGSYHTARTIPELRESGIGQIDTAYWALKGIPAIGPILQVSGEYGVRWGFVNRREFVPELKKNGWIFVKYLKNGVQVWENPKFTFKPPVIPPVDPFKSFSWGIFPILSFITTLSLGVVNWLKDGEKVICKTYTVLMGLLPISLGLWYYKTIFEFKHPQVYFTYDHALFFLSDALALLAVILWLAVRAKVNFLPKLSPLSRLLFAICSWITLSVFWSADWRTSLSIAIHFWLIFLLILSMQDWHEALNSIGYGFCISLAFQFFIGYTEFKGQSMQFLWPLDLHWPGLIDAGSQGASILKYANGENFLRVYGTFPHPNILAGFALTAIAAICLLFFSKTKLKWWMLIFLGMSISLIALSFSRSAWLGLVTFLLVLFFRLRSFDLKKTWLVISVCLVIFIATLLPLRELFASRTTSPSSATEEFSFAGRLWLSQKAWEYIKEKPFAGLGAGSFVIHLAQRDADRNYIEPVHNVPLLVFSELGIIGMILLISLVILLLKEFLTTNRPNVIILSALLAGMGIIMLFDHYFWSLAPCRMMLGLTLGLWQEQVAKHAE